MYPHDISLKKCVTKAYNGKSIHLGNLQMRNFCCNRFTLQGKKCSPWAWEADFNIYIYIIIYLC